MIGRIGFWAAVACLAGGAVLAGCDGGAGENLDAEYLHDLRQAPASAPSAGGGTADELAPAPLTETSSLDDYLATAARNNPLLKGAFARWRAAVERIAQEKSLPDPQFTYRYFIRGAMMADGEMRNVFEISQVFPWLPKLALKGDVAAREALAEYQRLQAQRLQIDYEVRDAFYEYYYLGRSIAVMEENVRLVEYLEGVARARYRTAAASQPDVLRAQVEMEKLRNELATLKDMCGPVAARLNAAMNRPADEPLPLPNSIDARPAEITELQLLEWLGQANPELKAMDLEAEARRFGVRLARQDYFPDVMLGFEYDDMVSTGGMQPDDPYGILISVNLPIWWQKYAAGVREAQARRFAAVQDRAGRANALASELKMAAYLFRDARRRLDLYSDLLLPKGRESLKSTEAAYRAGSVSFSDLVDAQRVLLEFQLAQHRALADCQQRLAQIEMLTGRQVPVPQTTSRPAASPKGGPK